MRAPTAIEKRERAQSAVTLYGRKRTSLLPLPLQASCASLFLLRALLHGFIAHEPRGFCKMVPELAGNSLPFAHAQQAIPCKLVLSVRQKPFELHSRPEETSIRPGSLVGLFGAYGEQMTRCIERRFDSNREVRVVTHAVPVRPTTCSSESPVGRP